MWDKLEQNAAQPEQAIELLISELATGTDPHLLFDALLLKWKYEKGLPLLQPTSVSDVPTELKSEFEQAYIHAAQTTGQKLIDNGRLLDAWMYFRAINQPDTVRQALAAYTPGEELNDELEEMLQLALYQAVHPSKGVEWMLKFHGMCNTVTALDQLYLDLSPQDRTTCARLMVSQLYDDLTHNVRYEVEQRSPFLPPDQSLRELIAGRLWLFENDNYHIDVSHLNAVVRFARALEATDTAELDKAIQLSEYGAMLAPHLQYPGEPPFDTYYESHEHYFQIVIDVQREQSLQYFQDRLASATESHDKELIAYVLVDLLMRVQDFTAAIKVAETHLNDTHEQSGFSFISLCQDTGDMAALQRHSQKINNPVLFLAARLNQ